MIAGALSTTRPLSTLMWRPGATQRVGPLVELHPVSGLGKASGRGQARRTATDHDHRIGHQVLGARALLGLLAHRAWSPPPSSSTHGGKDASARFSSVRRRAIPDTRSRTLSRMPDLEPVDESWSTALCVVAHPDDLEFGTAAAVARWTDQGKTVVYAMVSSGEAGIDGMDPAEARSVREAEQAGVGKDRGR